MKISSMKLINEKVVPHIQELQEFLVSNENREETFCFIYRKLIEKSFKLIGQNYQEKKKFYKKIFNSKIVEKVIQISNKNIQNIYNDNRKVVVLENCVKIICKVVQYNEELSEFALDNGLIEIIQQLLDIKREEMKDKKVYS